MRIMCLFFSFRKCLRHERYHIDKEVMAYKTSVLRRIDTRFICYSKQEVVCLKQSPYSHSREETCADHGKCPVTLVVFSAVFRCTHLIITDCYFLNVKRHFSSFDSCHSHHGHSEMLFSIKSKKEKRLILYMTRLREEIQYCLNTDKSIALHK